jgi:iron complex outermembrane receptor protein
MRIFFTWIVALCPLFLLSQINIQGKIIDAGTNEPLVGATISTDQAGEVSDLDGSFSLSIERGTDVTFSYLGYDDIVRNYTSSESGLVIGLKPKENILDIATVTSSRYEQNISESTVSIDILPARLIENTAATTISDVLIKVPGVQILDGQANIRGGSGFSFGAGSRVMLLLNDMPILQPDAGFASWNDIPVENISQVEVLKGSASAMYGTAALNGIINIRTKYATSDPETVISVGGRVYDSHSRPEIERSTDTPFEYFISGVHRSKLTDNLDLVVNGYLFDQESFADSTFQNRARLGFSTRYRPTDRLSLSLSAMINLADNSSFFLWDNYEEGNLTPFQNTVSKTKNQRIVIDPVVTYFDKSNNKHKLQTRLYLLDNDNSLNQSNSSANVYTEYQFQKELKDWDTNLTMGLVNQYLSTDSELFSDVKFTSYNLGAYAELDKRFFNRLKLSIGGRYEYNNLNVPEDFVIDSLAVTGKSDGAFIFKTGLNYSLAEYSHIRASFGQGYRFPTVVERFISTTFGNLAIRSNPSLLPETGWTSEIGIKQGFDLLGFKGFLDLAVFRQEYENMMEFVFLIPDFAFQSQNVGDTEINGLEVGVMGELYAGRFPIRLFGGYTYVDPRYKDLENNDRVLGSLSEPDQNILKYRSKHLFKMDVEASIDKFTFGLAANTVSNAVNIDNILEIVGGIGQYRDLNNQGYMVADLRLALNLERTTFSLLLNNVLNEEYTVRPGELEAPRNYGFKLEYKIQ